MSSSNNDDNTISSLIIKGCILGITHVLTGADHMSALATLSVRQKEDAFYIGARWGMGHSFGLILIAVIFFALNGELNLDKIDYYAAWFVGLFMLILGGMGIRKAYNTYNRFDTIIDINKQTLILNDTMEMESHDDNNNNNNNDNDHDRNMNSNMNIENGEGESSSQTSLTSSYSVNRTLIEDSIAKSDHTSNSNRIFNGMSTSKLRFSEESISMTNNNSNNNSKINLQFINDNDDFSHSHHSRHSSLYESITHSEMTNLKNPTIQKAMSLLAGILHGIAGPGGILGVIPAVNTGEWSLCFLYLAFFCTTSTIIMGLFAMLYADVTNRMGKSEKSIFYLEIFSSSLSIIIGILFLILLSFDKLDLFFD